MYWLSRSVLLGLLAHINHIATHVIATLWANNVRRNAGAAVWTVTGLLALDAVVRSPLARPRIGMLSLWYGHRTKSSKTVMDRNLFCSISRCRANAKTQGDGRPWKVQQNRRKEDYCQPRIVSSYFFRQSFTTKAAPAFRAQNAFSHQGGEANPSSFFEFAAQPLPFNATLAQKDQVFLG